MVAAYDTSGRLKKNPLRGTALGADPSRAKERKRFKTLHEEATSIAGKGRAGMQKRLASRYEQRTSAERGALGNLAEQYTGLQQQAQTLRDPEREKKLAARKQEATGDWERVKEAINTKGLAPSLVSDYAEALREEGKRVPKTRKAKKLAKKLGKGKFGGGLGGLKKYYGQQLSEVEQEQEDYRAKVDARAAELEEQGAPIAAEMQRRKGRLEDMIYSYNLFLGAM